VSWTPVETKTIPCNRMLERLFDEMFYTYFVRLHLEYACPV